MRPITCIYGMTNPTEIFCTEKCRRCTPEGERNFMKKDMRHARITKSVEKGLSHNSKRPAAGRRKNNVARAIRLG